MQKLYIRSQLARTQFSSSPWRRRLTVVPRSEWASRRGRAALACQRPLLAWLRFADAVAPTAIPADQSTPTPSTLVVVESSIRKFAREDVARRRNESVICPSGRHLVPAFRPTVPRAVQARAPTGRRRPPPRCRRVNLVARTINHSINATSYAPGFVFHCAPAALYTKTPLYNSRLPRRRQSSSHVRGQLCRRPPLLLQQPTASFSPSHHLISDTLGGWRVCTVSRLQALINYALMPPKLNFC